ncbi:SgcJ/EcaC family oxidoreductase [Lentzea sp. BCCO 10_0856]|uniref:SgcJ/EcaC family oxidoreductase n=1 Tax=Lentzea miocenica TaxID=3095431 RepID=A0ABU4SSC3_9PSEU|nr:SgcJ/EcaC family oxidoreductase [Lentzea sp. BCCO 10_0856]MDX8028792.1 SgcJ/EcaC family oxidoreductase [Lentzea sp. BCCO 10_0856]
MSIETVMDRWKDAVDAHDPERVASNFTEDAIFQGLKPYGIGRAAIAEYYSHQSIGLKADYEVLETRRLADDLTLGYLEVDFSFIDKPTINVNLSVLIKGDLIAHYQVSRL